MYKMTRDGFTILVMGYTGPKAMQFKIAYINQFNAMEAWIKQPESRKIMDMQSKLIEAYEREFARRDRKDNKFSEKEYTLIVELRNQRHTVPEIAYHLQRSRRTIQTHLKKARLAGLITAAPTQGYLFPEVH